MYKNAVVSQTLLYRATVENIVPLVKDASRINDMTFVRIDKEIANSN